MSKCALLLWVAFGVSARAAEYTNTLGGDWEVPVNWLAGTVPSGSDQIIIDGSVAAQDVWMDADSWQYIQNNGLQYNGTEYRTMKLLLGGTGEAALSVDIGSGNIWKATEGGTYYIGSSSGSTGTLNVISGEVILESSSMRIGQYAGSVGRINVSGSASTRLVFGRESSGESARIGTGGTGSLTITAGTFETRAGVTLGSSGLFHVSGSGASDIGIAATIRLMEAGCSKTAAS